MHDRPLIPEIPVLSPVRFQFASTVGQAKAIEFYCRHKTPAQIAEAMRAACDYIERLVKPEFYREPMVQAAAVLVLEDYLRSYTRRKNKPKCWREADTLIHTFRIGFYWYG